SLADGGGRDAGGARHHFSRLSSDRLTGLSRTYGAQRCDSVTACGGLLGADFLRLERHQPGQSGRALSLGVAAVDVLFFLELGGLVVVAVDDVKPELFPLVQQRAGYPIAAEDEPPVLAPYSGRVDVLHAAVVLVLGQRRDVRRLHPPLDVRGIADDRLRGELLVPEPSHCWPSLRYNFPSRQHYATPARRPSSPMYPTAVRYRSDCASHQRIRISPPSPLVLVPMSPLVLVP